MDAEVTHVTQDTPAPASQQDETSQLFEGSHELVDHLVRLCQLDIDVISAYERAAQAIEDEHHEIYNALLRFRDDHVTHVLELTNSIYGFGGQAPSIERDFQGALIEGMTALRSLTGTIGALKAMNMNEMLTNRSYEEALSWEMPNALRELIENFRADEVRHKEFIERALQRLGVNPEEWTRFNDPPKQESEGKPETATTPHPTH